MIIDLAAERARRLRIKQGAPVCSSTAALISHKRIPLPEYAQEPDASAAQTEPVEPVPAPARAVPEPLDGEPEPLEEIVWRTSARGNPWTRIGRAHIVIFPSRRNEGECALRLEYDGRPGRFLKRTWRSPEEAKAWVEANAHTVTR